MLETYQPLTESRQDLKTILVWIYHDVFGLAQGSSLLHQTRRYHSLLRAAWRGSESKIAVIKENTAQHKRFFTESVLAMETENSAKIRQELREGFERQRQIETDRRRDEDTRWFLHSHPVSF